MDPASRILKQVTFDEPQTPTRPRILRATTSTDAARSSSATPPTCASSTSDITTTSFQLLASYRAGLTSRNNVTWRDEQTTDARQYSTPSASARSTCKR